MFGEWKVTTLIDEALTPGTHKVVFEANGLVSGIYFYRIQAGEFVQTKAAYFAEVKCTPPVLSGVMPGTL